METERLYYQDSHLREFSARVLSCTQGKTGWDVVLDRTAFYPEGGGQPYDQGILGGAAVLEVHSRGEEIVHTCAEPLETGAQVRGEIDWARRFDLMQQHSGEHIVSGLIHKAYGFENVGFHMGKDLITIDLSGELDEAQLLEIETEANRVVWRDEPVHIFYPTAQELGQLPYRSKKELTGQVRLVEFPGADLCACCGTHVLRAGEIGLIRLLSCVHFRGGVRVEMACGGRALAHTQAVWAQNRRISNLLSAKPLETAAAAERTAAELGRVKFQKNQLEDRLFADKAKALAGAGDVLLLEPGLEPDGLRRLAIAAAETCGGCAAVFSGDDEGGYQYALCCHTRDLRALSKELNQALQGRGGGKPELVQGSLRASEREIRQFWEGIDHGTGY